MAATFNPQAAADQARNAYRNVTTQLGLLALDTAIPEVGALAEKTVDQTREAYDRSKDALEASITTFERSFDAAGWGAAAFNRKFDIAQRNVNSGFDLANSLAGAKNLAEIVELQAAYWRKQFSNQGKCLGAIFEHRPGCGGQWKRTRPAVHSRRMNVGGNIGFQAVSN
jgi:hypothetical protein